MNVSEPIIATGCARHLTPLDIDRVKQTVRFCLMFGFNKRSQYGCEQSPHVREEYSIQNSEVVSGVKVLVQKFNRTSGIKFLEATFCCDGSKVETDLKKIMRKGKAPTLGR